MRNKRNNFKYLLSAGKNYGTVPVPAVSFNVRFDSYHYQVLNTEGS
jgi:hypothetical protein